METPKDGFLFLPRPRRIYRSIMVARRPGSPHTGRVRHMAMGIMVMTGLSS